ncbi:MAG: YtxH domain-containing protein [Anaerolineae bacterium]|nr:YtxH domain-containing protein [Anaerolineae bacterium]
MRRFGFLVLGAAVGGLLGAVLAMLLAPSSGPQLRTNLRNRGIALVDEVKKAAAEKRLMLEQEINELRYRH